MSRPQLGDTGFLLEPLDVCACKALKVPVAVVVLCLNMGCNLSVHEEHAKRLGCPLLLPGGL
eukprot:m.25820 g.25820  ORF g.25820 m.25820 type:complete len:62 (-) comp11629_c0_seq4:299-484(-)